VQHLTIKRRWWHRLFQTLAATDFGIWLLASRLHQLDAPVLRWTKNRTSLTSWLTGLPVIMLETRGTKTGLPRRTPLVALVDGDKIILIASYFGSKRHPAWYYNLKAHPQAVVFASGETFRYYARQAEGVEHARYYKMAEAVYPGYALYKHKAGSRTIPVMVLEPKG
jgi:deazaflavin-dependent oxidoreductase (nitroreductase family)